MTKPERAAAEIKAQNRYKPGAGTPLSDATRYFNTPGFHDPRIISKAAPWPGFARTIGRAVTHPLVVRTMDYLGRPQSATITSMYNLLDRDPKTTLTGGLRKGLAGRGLRSWGPVLSRIDPFEPHIGRVPYLGRVYTAGRNLLFDFFGDPVTTVPPAKAARPAYRGAKAIAGSSAFRRNLSSPWARRAAIAGAATLRPDESEAAVKLATLADKAFFARAVWSGKFEVPAIEEIFRRLRRGDDITYEMIGSFAGPQVYPRPVRNALLNHSPHPSFVKYMGPLDLWSKYPKKDPQWLGRFIGNRKLYAREWSPEKKLERYLLDPYTNDVHDLWEAQSRLLRNQRFPEPSEGFWNEVVWRLSPEVLKYVDDPADLPAGLVLAPGSRFTREYRELVGKYRLPVYRMTRPNNPCAAADLLTKYHQHDWIPGKKRGLWTSTSEAGYDESPVDPEK